MQRFAVPHDTNGHTFRIKWLADGLGGAELHDIVDDERLGYLMGDDQTSPDLPHKEDASAQPGCGKALASLWCLE